MKLYTLYPTIDGYSTRTIDYVGAKLSIAAQSIKQAYYFAHQRVWAESPENPAGIVEHYSSSGAPQGWHRLWCGCQVHGGIGLENGMSMAALVRAMRAHDCS